MQVVINLFWLLLAVILVSVITVFIVFAVSLIKAILSGNKYDNKQKNKRS